MQPGPRPCKIGEQPRHERRSDDGTKAYQAGEGAL